jgi:hypothetical protein
MKNLLYNFLQLQIYSMSDPLISNCIVPFSLTKRNDLGVAYANVYLIAQPPLKNVPQFVNTGSSIFFNKFSRLASIAWLTANELTFLKGGNFRVQFSINYSLNFGNVQISLYVNNIPVVGTYGTIINISGGSQITGEFTLKFNTGDVIQLVNTSGSFVISQTGPLGQILANLTVTEVSNP